MVNDAAVWIVASLGELGEFRNGINFSKEDYGDGLPIVNVKQLYRGRYADVQGLLEVRRSAISNVDAVLLQYGDILFARSSVKASGAGQAAMVGPCPLNAVFSGFIIRFRVKATDRAVPEFLNYLLRSPFYRELLTRIGSGTTITNLSQRTLAGLQVKLPPVNEQQAIACILGTLDDKIELNRRMNQTLEGIARAIFKSWFVDFDPVRAKAAGQQPPGLAPHITDLFPDEFEASELGEIPKGWQIKPLDRIAHYQNGLALQKYPPEDDEYLPVIKIRELRQGRPDDRSGKASPNIKSSCVVEDGDVVFSWSGSLLVDLWCGGRGALNQHLFKVTSKRYHKWFYYYWTKHHLGEFRRIAAGKATTMGHIKRSHLNSALTHVPPDELLQTTDKAIGPVIDRIIVNSLESHTLAALRNTLLPKLISGELCVPDAEKFCMEVGR